MSTVSEYRQIGPSVEAGEVYINAAQAEQFRLAALDGNKVRDHIFSFNKGIHQVKTSTYAPALVFEGKYDIQSSDVGCFTSTDADLERDFWRSSISFTKMSRSDDTDSLAVKLYDRYIVESHKGEIVKAVRNVRMLRFVLQSLVNDEGQSYEAMDKTKRVAFEFPIKPTDIEHVTRKMARIASRQPLFEDPIISWG